MEKIKAIIKENFNRANCGLFFTRNLVGDEMYTIYDDGRVIIDICYQWGYYEVFGLSAAEKQELEKFYNGLEYKL